jgi:hypothetical protein
MYNEVPRHLASVMSKVLSRGEYVGARSSSPPGHETHRLERRKRIVHIQACANASLQQFQFLKGKDGQMAASPKSRRREMPQGMYRLVHVSIHAF